MKTDMKIRRAAALMFVILGLLILCSCGEETANTSTIRLTEKALAHAGIDDAVIREQADMIIEHKPCKVSLVYSAMDTSDEVYYERSYIAIEMSDRLILNPVDTGSFGGKIYACDLDCDGTDEIILQQTVGSSGGAGQYASTIFRHTDDGLTEIFAASTANPFDTGFGSTAKDGFILEITNSYTKYSKQLHLPETEKYIGVYFDENGTPISEEGILCDSFCEFYPEDTDKDGIPEIVCCQYVSLYGHSDNVGYAWSVLRFNPKAEAFDVIESEFKN